jgi:hypothetical protein
MDSCWRCGTASGADESARTPPKVMDAAPLSGAAVTAEVTIPAEPVVAVAQESI